MKKNGDLVPYLCMDIVYEILLRLPAADVHRCRFVCSEWRALVAEEWLVVNHRRRRSPMPLFFYRRNFLGPLGRGPEDGPLIDRFDLQAVDLAARESRRVLRFADFVHNEEGEYFDGLKLMFFLEVQPIRVEASCDGILVLSSPDTLYACNPFTRHWALLPPVHHGDVQLWEFGLPPLPGPPVYQGNGVLAFYARDRVPPGAGREYCLLYQTSSTGPFQDQEHTYWIYLLAGAESRHIGRPMSPAMPAPELGALLWDGLPPAFFTPPVMYRGCLHWAPQYVQAVDGYKMVVFDTVAEEFSWMNPPPLPNAEDDEDGVILYWFQPLHIKGELALAMINRNDWRLERPDAEIKLWLLTDYDNATWELRYKIGRMPPTVINDDHEYDAARIPPLHLVFRSGLELLVPCPATLLQCDDQWVQLQAYGRPGSWVALTPHFLEESFELHPFLSAVGNDVNPPFFHFQLDEA